MEELRDQLQNNLTVASPNIIMVDVPLKADAWHAYIGSIPDDELMGEWRKAVDDYRRQKDEELKDQVG